jgi:multimeric flavodoxin WrbA
MSSESRTTISIRVCVVYFSQFRGATEQLARAVARGAESVPGTDVQLIPVEEVEAHWGTLHGADAIVFGTPTYIGSVAAKFKEFIEKLAGEVWLERMWVNKIAAGFTVSAGRSGDKLACLQQLVTFAAQLGMLWVPLRITGGNYSSAGSESDLNRMAGYLGVMAQANIDEPAEQAPPKSDIETAELHGNHIAHVTRQFACGRRAAPADYDRFVSEGPEERRPATLAELLSG